MSSDCDNLPHVPKGDGRMGPICEPRTPADRPAKGGGGNPGVESPDAIDEDADDIAASRAAKSEGVAGSYDDLRRELGLK